MRTQNVWMMGAVLLTSRVTYSQDRTAPTDKVKAPYVGWAADGFPIYARWDYVDAKNARSGVRVMRSSYKIKEGTRPGGPGGRFDGTYVEDFEYIAQSGDLDECGGHFGVVPASRGHLSLCAHG